MIRRTNKAPYLGAAYYPEDWSLSQIPIDIEIMKEMGMNAMRIAEFAWSTMEPQEGVFDFSWLREVVDRLTDAEISVVMCTPSATPPVWLVTRFPDMLAVNERGMKKQHGARRHCCSNNPHYREYTKRIVARMAKEFAKDGNITAWQLDNEICQNMSGPDRGCYCPVCVAKFRGRLEKKFGYDITKLNKAWNLSLWSMDYQSFDQIPAPMPHTWHHPSLSNEWSLFQSDSNAEFLDMQVETLKENGVTVPIGTDMMPTNLQQYTRTNKNMDIVMFNHYNGKENFYQAGLWMDYIRPMKSEPFMNTETDACWTGGVNTHSFHPEGYCRANSWLPVALGGQANMYWLWRMHWNGQEIMHGAVISSQGRPNHTEHEIREIAAGFEAASDFLNAAPVEKSPLAIHFSDRAWIDWGTQPVTSALTNTNFWQPGAYKIFCENFYKPVNELGFRPDLLDPSADLDGVKLLITPLVPYIPDENLEKIKDFVKNGGIWIAGPLTNIRNEHGSRFTHAPFGVLEEWTGVYTKYTSPNSEFKIKWNFAQESDSAVVCTAFEPNGAESLGEYSEGPFAGLSAAVKKAYGSGAVIILGTQPDPETMKALIAKTAQSAGIEAAAKTSENIMLSPRRGASAEGIVAVEAYNKPGYIELKTPMTNLITGEKLSGRVEIKPYGVLALKR